jgi:hypothetical protein
MEMPIIWFCNTYLMANVCCGIWHKTGTSPQNIQQSCRAASATLKRAMKPSIWSQRIKNHNYLFLYRVRTQKTHFGVPYFFMEGWIVIFYHTGCYLGTCCNCKAQYSTEHMFYMHVPVGTTAWREALARVPIGNIARAAPGYLIDIWFARTTMPLNSTQSENAFFDSDRWKIFTVCLPGSPEQ